MKRYYTILEISNSVSRSYSVVKSRAKHLDIDIMRSKIDSRDVDKLIESLADDYYSVHPRQNNRGVKLNHIEKVVADYFKVELFELIKKGSYKAQSTMIRMVLFYLMKTRSGKQNAYLSKRYGYDPSKFHKAVRVVNDRLSYDKKFIQIIEDLINRL